VDIAVLIYEGVTVLDAIGPYDVLARLPDAHVRFVGLEKGSVRSDNGALGLVTDHALEDVPAPDVMVIPGGSAGTMRAAGDEKILSWVRGAHETSTWTTSVCTGALILGAAGVLQGKKATTHWAAKDMLQTFGAQYAGVRFVREGKVITAAGVSAGIDMALYLAGEIAGPEIAQAIQLMLEYDPDPPFDSGSPAKATPEIRELSQRLLAGG
jgi:putative intracellular protease/amidase